MRRRTWIDLSLLVLFSLLGAWLFSLRKQRAAEAPPASPTATPRALDFIKTLDLPPPPTQAPRARPTPTPFPTEVPRRAMLVLQIASLEGDYSLVSETPAFRSPVRNGRNVLQLADTRPLVLHLEDAWGRSTESVEVQPSIDNAVTLDFSPPIYRNASPGLRLRPGNAYAEVDAVESGSAAAVAGIQSGDRVTHIQDQPCAGMTTEELRDLLLGDSGSAVELRIQITTENGESEEHRTTLERR